MTRVLTLPLLLLRPTNIAGLSLRKFPQLWSVWLLSSGPGSSPQPGPGSSWGPASPAICPTTGLQLHVSSFRGSSDAFDDWSTPAWTEFWGALSEPAQPCVLTSSSNSASWHPNDWAPRTTTTYALLPAARLSAATKWWVFPKVCLGARGFSYSGVLVCLLLVLLAKWWTRWTASGCYY